MAFHGAIPVCILGLSLSFSTRRTDTSVRQLDQAKINSYQLLMWDYTSRLDSLQAGHSKCPALTQWQHAAEHWHRPFPQHPLLAPSLKGLEWKFKWDLGVFWVQCEVMERGEGRGSKTISRVPNLCKVSFSSLCPSSLLPPVCQALDTQSWFWETSSLFAHHPPHRIYPCPQDPGAQYQVPHMNALPAL